MYGYNYSRRYMYSPKHGFECHILSGEYARYYTYSDIRPRAQAAEADGAVPRQSRAVFSRYWAVNGCILP